MKRYEETLPTVTIEVSHEPTKSFTSIHLVDCNTGQVDTMIKSLLLSMDPDPHFYYTNDRTIEVFIVVKVFKAENKIYSKRRLRTDGYTFQMIVDNILGAIDNYTESQYK